MNPNFNLLVAINAGTLIAIITIGYKIISFLNDIKFKTNLMWVDYEENHNLNHNRRSTDNLLD